MLVTSVRVVPAFLHLESPSSFSDSNHQTRQTTLVTSVRVVPAFLQTPNVLVLLPEILDPLIAFIVVSIVAAQDVDAVVQSVRAFLVAPGRGGRVGGLGERLPRSDEG